MHFHFCTPVSLIRIECRNSLVCKMWPVVFGMIDAMIFLSMNLSRPMRCVNFPRLQPTANRGSPLNNPIDVDAAGRIVGFRSLKYYVYFITRQREPIAWSFYLKGVSLYSRARCKLHWMPLTWTFREGRKGMLLPS